VVSYAALNQRHPSYDATHQTELAALYDGGKKLEVLYPRLLKQRPKEPALHWQLRTSEAEYRNYLGPIIDYFASMLFVSRTVNKPTRDEKPVEDAGEYWSKFREDCDGGGTDIDDLFKSLLTSAMIERTGWLRLHQPSDGAPPPTDAAEFEARKLGECWVEKLEGCDVLDWDAGEEGRLLWAVTHHEDRKRSGLAGDRKRVVETWQYLTPESVETYRVEYESDKKPKDDDEIGRLGPPVTHSFGHVPLVCLDLPPALWVANRLRSPQLAHFRKVCAQAWSLAATCYAMPVVKVEDATEYLKQTSGAGYEIVIGQQDDYTWQAPPTGHFSSLDTEIKSSKDEIFRIAHQMALGVENNAAAVGRSAESKASDAESTRVVLVAFSRIVRETIEYTYDLISRARGEKYTWSVEGLDDFAALDAAAFLADLKTLGDAGRTIPSKTFQIAVNERTAELFLPHMDETTKATVRKEIKAGTTDPAEDAKLEREAAAALFAPGSGAPQNGAKRPGEAAKPPIPPKGGGSGRAS
jgi:hypothetical protein